MSASPSWTNWLPAANAAMGISRGVNQGGAGGAGSALRGLGSLSNTAAKFNPGGYGGALSSLGNYAGGAGNAAGVLSGVQQGGVGGYGSAAINAGQLANRAGAFGSDAGAAGQGLGAAGAGLGVYQGIQQGGAAGYGKAAANAGELALGSAAAWPLAAYNFVQNDTASGRTGSDAAGGAMTGAEVGAAFGPVGMGVGALIGGAAGALSSAFGPGAVDPENMNFEGYHKAYNDALQHGGQQAADRVAQSNQNPYLALAGYMDLRKGQIGDQNPIYNTYGRMGEEKFANDLVSHLTAAQKTGQIKPGESAAQAYNDVVNPWVSGMGAWNDPNKQAMQGVLEQMTAQELNGQAGNDWKAIGGDSPFASLSPTTTQASKPVMRRANANGQQMLAAKGGSISAKLRKLYEGSFKDRHYDDGGGVDYFTPSYTNMTQEQSPPDTSSWELPTNQAGLASTFGQTGLNNLGDPGTISETTQASNSLNDSSFAPGGALSGLGSMLGVSNMGQFVKQYGALAPLLSAALSKNKPASAPATPAGYGAIPSIATPTNPRSYTQPNVANWYTYGQGPEQSFFSNNQLPNVPGVSPAQATPPAAAPGAPNMSTQPIKGPVMAAGGSFDSTAGDDYVSDPGHGDGTSDGIDAKLSGGEYVMDAGTVATLGNGSNEAGARALDQLRQRVRKHAGKQLVKGKQFMKARSPEKYLKRGTP